MSRNQPTRTVWPVVLNTQPGMHHALIESSPPDPHLLKQAAFPTESACLSLVEPRWVVTFTLKPRCWGQRGKENAPGLTERPGIWLKSLSESRRFVYRPQEQLLNQHQRVHRIHIPSWGLLLSLSLDPSNSSWTNTRGYTTSYIYHPGAPSFPEPGPQLWCDFVISRFEGCLLLYSIPGPCSKLQLEKQM